MAKYNFKAFDKEFPDDATCLEYIFNLRFPEQKCESFYRHTTQRSRKARFCAWCGQKIHVGEFYVRENALHPECRMAAEETMRKDGIHEIEYYGDDERPFIQIAEGI